jgi:hypothetical protein
MIRLRAVLGAVAILLSALSTPVTLAAQTDDNVCSMTCCVDDGYCCCKPRRAFVKGQMSDDRDKVSNADFVKPCSQGCTTSHTSFKLKEQDSVRTAIPHFSSIDVITTPDHTFSHERKAEYQISSPRAPPLSLFSA